MGTNDKPSTKNAISAILDSVFGPLIEKTSTLPPALAYGSAIVIAILAVSLLGALVPSNLLWFLGVIVLVSLLAFVFADWDKRRTAHKERLAKQEKEGLAIFYVVVHEEGDPNEYIPGAEVRVGLPKPEIQKTQENGVAIFQVPTVYLKGEYHISARKDGYEKQASIQQRINVNDHIKISLKRSEKAVASDARVNPKRQSRLRLIQVKPEQGGDSESTSGRLMIGRDPDSELALPETAKGVSWEHGIIELINNQYIYRHLSKSQPTTIVRMDGSSTLLEGGKKGESTLQINDRLLIGNYEFVVAYDLMITDKFVYYTGTK